MNELCTHPIKTIKALSQYERAKQVTVIITRGIFYTRAPKTAPFCGHAENKIKTKCCHIGAISGTLPGQNISQLKC